MRKEDQNNIEKVAQETGVPEETVRAIAKDMEEGRHRLATNDYE